MNIKINFKFFLISYTYSKYVSKLDWVAQDTV